MNSAFRVAIVCFASLLILPSAIVWGEQGGGHEANRAQAQAPDEALQRQLSKIERELDLLLELFEEVQELRRVVQPQPNSPVVAVYPLQRTTTTLAASVLNKTFRLRQDDLETFAIEADMVNNSMIVIGPPEIIEVAMRVLDRIDRKNRVSSEDEGPTRLQESSERIESHESSFRRLGGLGDIEASIRVLDRLERPLKNMSRTRLPDPRR